MRYPGSGGVRLGCGGRGSSVQDGGEVSEAS